MALAPPSMRAAPGLAATAEPELTPETAPVLAAAKSTEKETWTPWRGAGRAAGKARRGGGVANY